MKVGNSAVLRSAASLALLAMLAACATSSGEFGADRQLSVIRAGGLPQPEGEDFVASGGAYEIVPFDKLAIKVFGVDGLEDHQVQVDAGGGISVPLVGWVDARGKTIPEFEELLSQKLRAAYIRDPQVSVSVRETVNRTIAVDGQVNKPGIYPVLGKMSLLRAVAAAGSTSEFAKLEDVVVFREVGGKRYAGLYNLSAIRNGAYADPEIFPNDTVVVGDSPARRLFKDILQAAPLLTTPFIYLFQRPGT